MGIRKTERATEDDRSFRCVVAAVEEGRIIEPRPSWMVNADDDGDVLERANVARRVGRSWRTMVSNRNEERKKCCGRACVCWQVSSPPAKTNCHPGELSPFHSFIPRPYSSRALRLPYLPTISTSTLHIYFFSPIRSPQAMTSWRESKDAAAKAYRAERWVDALDHYTSALDQLSSSSSSKEDVQRRDEVAGRGCGGGRGVSSDHQILLSNVIACRLKIGGTDMVEKAVEEAKKVRCVIVSITGLAYLLIRPKNCLYDKHCCTYEKLLRPIEEHERRREMISNHSLVRVHDTPPTRVWR